VSDSPANQADPECLSCGVRVTETRLACTYASASFSTEKSYYNLNCNGPDVPGTIIFKKVITLNWIFIKTINLPLFNKEKIGLTHFFIYRLVKE